MTTEPLLVLGSSFKLYKASYSSFVRSLNLLEGIAMSNSLSYKKLRFVSMIMSLFLGLKEDLGLNLSVAKDWPLFLKFRISSSFLPYSANSVFSFTESTFWTAGTNLKPLDNNETSEAERYLIERFTTLLLTKLPSNFTPFCEAILHDFKTLPFSQLWDSL